MTPRPQPPQTDAFWLMVGKCIGAWANVEEALFRIVWKCLGPYEQSAIVYYKTPSLEARFTLADELVESVLPKTKPGKQHHPSVKSWTAAKSGYDKLLSVRRRIAHQPVGAATAPLRAGMALDEGPAFWLEIFVSQQERTRKRSSGHQPLLIEDLSKHRVALRALSERLQQFHDDVLTKRDSASPPPAPQSRG